MRVDIGSRDGGIALPTFSDNCEQSQHSTALADPDIGGCAGIGPKVKSVIRRDDNARERAPAVGRSAVSPTICATVLARLCWLAHVSLVYRSNGEPRFTNPPTGKPVAAGSPESHVCTVCFGKAQRLAMPASKGSFRALVPSLGFVDMVIRVIQSALKQASNRFHNVYLRN
jgi:hypothetical protein